MSKMKHATNAHIRCDIAITNAASCFGSRCYPKVNANTLNIWRAEAMVMVRLKERAGQTTMYSEGLAANRLDGAYPPV